MAAAERAKLRVERLSAERRTDFYRVHAAQKGAGWCFCVAWWVETWDGWGARSAEANRDLRERLFRAGEHDGYLAYADGAPVGWCQVGPRDRLAKLVRQLDLAPDPDVWAITCFQVDPDRRRRGVAAALLAGVLDDLRARGVRRVEAYPKRGVRADGELWTGPEALFTAAGFAVRRDDPERPVLSLALPVVG